MIRFINSVRELLAIYIGVLIAAAVAYSLFEHKPFIESLWWACVTATTVGYGDMYPATIGGKLVAALLMHVALLFILPLLIGNICARCVEDQHAFTHDEQEEIKATLRKIEARLDELNRRD